MPARHPRKPLNLTFGVDEHPPWAVSVALAFQYVILMSSNLIIPVLLVNLVGGTPEQLRSLVCFSMIVGGIGTILQGLKRGPVGSGYLIPDGGAGAYVPACVLAVQTGGFSLLFGMLLVAGAFQGLISRFVHRLRVIFPPEITGLIVFMVGVSLIPIALRLFFGLGEGADFGELSPVAVLVGGVSLGVMVGGNIWGRGILRENSLLLGIIVGYGLAMVFHLYAPWAWTELAEASLLALPPFEFWGWSFSWGMLPVFLIAALCASLECVGDVTTCQKINDADWKRPDMENISQGILSESIKTGLSGLLGGLAMFTDSASIGVSLATGVTSRVIAYLIGGIFILLAFLPKLSVILSVMPAPVMGAVLIFCITFMLLNGIQVFMSRMLDTRKTLIIGFAVTFGLSVDMLPGLYRDLPHFLQPFFSSSLTVAAVTALVLHLVFRLGIAQKNNLELMPGDASVHDAIFAFMEVQGGIWGARREVVARAAAAINEFIETAAALALAEGSVSISTRFDEFNLDIFINYRGELLEFPLRRPSEAELLADETAFNRLSGFLMRHYADRIKATAKGEECQVVFHFDH